MSTFLDNLDQFRPGVPLCKVVDPASNNEIANRLVVCAYKSGWSGPASNKQ